MAKIEVGLGPLHSQFDGDGNVYTSLFLEPAVGRWSLNDLAKVTVEKI